MRIYIFIVFFFLLGAFFIISEKNLHITNSEEIKVLRETYSGWIDDVFKNSADLVGHVVKLDWLPEENLEV